MNEIVFTEHPLSENPITQLEPWKQLVALGNDRHAAHDREGMVRIMWALLDFLAEHFEAPANHNPRAFAESSFMHLCNEELCTIADNADRLGAAFDECFAEFLRNEGVPEE